MQKKVLWLGLLLLLLSLGALFIGFTTHNNKSDVKNDKLHESIIIYSTIPSNINQIISDAYNTNHKKKIEIISISNEDFAKCIKEKKKFEQGVFILAPKDDLMELSQAGILNGNLNEYGEWINEKFEDPKGKWLGLWYDPVVFAYNMDYLRNNWMIPNTWSDISKAPKLKITTMDFLNTYAGANILYSLAEDKGEEQALKLLKSFHGHIVRYGKYLSSPVRMVGMGEADMSIAMQSEVLKYRNDKYPVAVIYPQEGTAYLLTGIGMLKPLDEDSKEVLKWMLSDELQLVLQYNQLYFMPTNENSLAAEKYSNGKIKLLKSNIILNDKEKNLLLDRWVKEVRLGK